MRIDGSNSSDKRDGDVQLERVMVSNTASDNILCSCTLTADCFMAAILNRLQAVL